MVLRLSDVCVIKSSQALALSTVPNTWSMAAVWDNPEYPTEEAMAGAIEFAANARPKWPQFYNCPG